MTGRVPVILSAPLVVRACQLLTGALFAWAALAKISDLAGFAQQLHNFRMLPLALENLTAMTLPWVELVAALALILGVRARAGALTATVLLVGFTLTVGVALARGLDIECGCFGTADATRVGWGKLAQNAAMLAVALGATLRPAGRSGD